MHHVHLIISVFFFLSMNLFAQDNYEQARKYFDDGQLDSARYLINISLSKNPQSEDYFLSGLIHEAQGAPLRAVSDYEAVIKKGGQQLEAYFQKGLIYYHSGSREKAIEDFTYVIDHIDQSETQAIYFGNDPNDGRGTFLTTLQSMKGKVYQYRGLAYKDLGKWEKAMSDFEVALENDAGADIYVNRSQLYSKMGKTTKAIEDLNHAVSLDPLSYVAWYNLILLDSKTRIPDAILADETFVPLLNLLAANAYENNEYEQALEYYTKALENNPYDDLALIGRGKAYLRLEKYLSARKDFINALQENSSRKEALYLIGNSFFYQKSFEEAISFYEQYLSTDPLHEHVLYNVAVSYLSVRDEPNACIYLRRASNMGMDQATEQMSRYCTKQ